MIIEIFGTECVCVCVYFDDGCVFKVTKAFGILSSGLLCTGPAL